MPERVPEEAIHAAGAAFGWKSFRKYEVAMQLEAALEAAAPFIRRDAVREVVGLIDRPNACGPYGRAALLALRDDIAARFLGEEGE